MVFTGATDWRKELGLPDEPTDEDIDRALEALCRWYAEEERLEQERHREGETLLGEAVRGLSGRRRLQRANEVRPRLPPRYTYGDLPVWYEYERRRHVLCLRLRPDATTEEIERARAERIRRHLAAELDCADSASLLELAETLRLKLEPARRAVANALGLPGTATWERLEGTVTVCHRWPQLLGAVMSEQSPAPGSELDSLDGVLESDDMLHWLRPLLVLRCC